MIKSIFGKAMHWTNKLGEGIGDDGGKPDLKRKNSNGENHSSPNGCGDGPNPFKQPRVEQWDSSVDTVNLQEQRRSLPIASARKRFLEEVQKHASVILIGETGSGKTTQIPQFLHEERLDSQGSIAVTQPRRMAAISIAGRVSQEMGVALGTMVGFKVRFEDMSDAKSKIVYLTDGMLLREAMLDPKLMRYSWIVLDEAHERTINTDILFGVVKVAQLSRSERNEKPLKVIVMSATLDAEKFSQYFRNAPILYVAGRQFPVNVRHASQSQDDWQGATLSTIFQIHKEAPDRHDILVFLTGQEEIDMMCRQIKQISKDMDGPKIIATGLYAAQSQMLQQRIFLPTKPGFRKIILSTNIAETSLTIPGIRYVIDSCRVKAKAHQASTGLDMLKVVKISQAQAWQRTGRAGREVEGHCYRILTKAEFDLLPVNSVPEILRCNLTSVVLQMLSIGVKDVEKFDFLERPPDDAIAGALRQLRLLGAVDAGNTMTELGKKMSSFPLDPRFTRMLLSGVNHGCTEDILTIVAILSGDSILVTPTVKREEALAARKKFVMSEGDHLTYLKLFRAFKTAPNQKEWCQLHYVHQKHMNFAVEIRSQLMNLCRKENIPIQSSGNQSDNVRRAMVQGLFTNVARLTREGHYVTLDSKQQVKIHPSSVMFQTKPELVLFTELIATQKSYIRDLTLVDSNWLLEAQPEYFRQHRLVTSD